jgi:FAD/FMN-containing dehydrogenase
MRLGGGPGRALADAAQPGFQMRDETAAAGIHFVHQRPTFDPKIAGIEPHVAALGASVSNANAQAVQAADIGFGIQNLSLLGGAGKICTQSPHLIRSPFNNDPGNSATVGGNGRVSYASSLANLSGFTVVLSGPELSKNNSTKRQQSDGYSFDAIFTLTPQFFAAGVSSATLIFTISPGPNAPC